LVIIALLLEGWIASGAPRHPLSTHVPAAVAGLHPIGRMAASDRLTLAIGLPLNNPGALSAFLDQLYDPQSPGYRKFLTTAEFTERFGPSPHDYKAAVNFFRTQGFRIQATYPNRVLLNIEGSVGDIERTLHIAVRIYRHPTEARTFFAPDVEPTLELNTQILHISGLDNFILPRPAHLVASDRPPTTAPQSGSGSGGSYLGADFRAAYAPGVSLTGTGQFVGLLQFDGFYASDITAYRTLAGLPYVPVRTILLDGFDGTPHPNNVEVALDIEMAMSMAPGLTGVLVYEGYSGDSMLNRMAADNVAKQLSASWSFGTTPTTDQIFQEFAAQGQSYFNASGDSGAYAGSIPAPSDSPYITSVGGTTLSMQGRGAAWSSETAWNWRSTGKGPGATSGGISPNYNIPTWQQGISMTANQGSLTERNIPDVAMVADNVIVIADNGTTTHVGGTSIASPLWAGFMALVNQQAAMIGSPPVGFLNPAVYAIGESTGYTNAFRDIKTGNNTNLISPALFYAVTGYDLCTGWGTPAGKGLIDALATPTNRPSITKAGSSLVLETCSAANGFIDPGEAVVVNFTLQNVGGITTSNLVATLQTNDSVLYASGHQAYGALTGMGPAVSRAFSFTANGACGGSVSAVLNLQDGTTNLGSVTFEFPLGAPTAALAENFDLVSAPVLPSGWTTSVSGGGSAWVTSAALQDSGSLSAYGEESLSAGIGELVSPSFLVESGNAQLSFRNNYITEIDPLNAASAYDGGVLEINIGGGGWTDILDAGGSFVSGGYTRTIDPLGDNPLGGRRVWAGNSGGFITSLINLPVSAAGQTVQLMWRFGTDILSDFGSGAWYIDTVLVRDGTTCCTPVASADLAVSQSVAPSLAATGQDITYSIGVTNLGPGPASSITLTDTLPSSAAFVSASPGCQLIGSTVLCTAALLPAGQATNFSITVSASAVGTITNLLSAASPIPDPNPDNNNLALVSTVIVRPDLTLNPLDVTSTNVAITFNSLVGVTYSLEYKSALSDPVWTPIPPPIPGTGGSLSLHDTNGVAVPIRFYRVRCY
jgi:uncharacterized repeat protein (TIGR01451 family)